MFELAWGVPEPLAREAMRLAGHKLPVTYEVRDARGRREMMTAPDLRDLSEQRACSSTSRTARRELVGLRFQHATGRAGEHRRAWRRTKREIARALTIQRERELRNG